MTKPDISDGGSPTRPDPAPVYRIRDMPSRLRPREEMARRGVTAVSDAVLLAILLRTGTRGINVVELAEKLLHRYGSLAALGAAGPDELAAQRGIGAVKAQTLCAALELGRRLTQERTPERARVTSAPDVVHLLRPLTQSLEREVFWVLLLDAKNRLKGKPIATTRGLLDASLVHPREVFREAIRHAAAAIIVAHNHPSGDATPSAADLRVTRQLVSAGRIVDIQVLDHIILGAMSENDAGYRSLREDGLVDFNA